MTTKKMPGAAKQSIDIANMATPTKEDLDSLLEEAYNRQGQGNEEDREEVHEEEDEGGDPDLVPGNALTEHYKDKLINICVKGTYTYGLKDGQEAPQKKATLYQIWLDHVVMFKDHKDEKR
jgi:hypothetical protein